MNISGIITNLVVGAELEWLKWMLRVNLGTLSKSLLSFSRFFMILKHCFSSLKLDILDREIVEMADLLQIPRVTGANFHPQCGWFLQTPTVGGRHLLLWGENPFGASDVSPWMVKAL